MYIHPGRHAAGSLDPAPCLSHNICRPSVRTLLHVTLPATRILKGASIFLRNLWCPALNNHNNPLAVHNRFSICNCRTQNPRVSPSTAHSTALAGSALWRCLTERQTDRQTDRSALNVSLRHFHPFSVSQFVRSTPLHGQHSAQNAIICES